MENVEKKPKSTKNTNAKDVDKKVSTSKASKANATTQDRTVKSNASKQSASKRGVKTEPKQTDEVVKGQEVAVDTADVERNSSSDDFSIQSQGERIKKNAGKNSKRKKAAIATAVVLLVTASVAVPTAVYLSRRKVSVDISNNIDIIQEYTVNVNRGSTIKDIVPQEITGYTFVGFYKDAELTVPYKDTDKINKNMTIYAKYEANEYKVTFPTSPAFTIEGEDIVNNQVEIEYNTEYRFKLNLATGYNESDITVKVNGETVTPDQDGYYTLTIYGDTLVEVEGVEINTYEVTFYDSLEKNEMYQTLDIQYNQLCTYTGVTPTKHSTHTYTYTFIGWVDAEGNEVDLSTTHIVSDLELFANFREEYIEYTISKPEQVNVKFGDLYLSNTATLHYGDIVEITYDTTEGHDVTAFSVSGAEKVEGSENQYRITGNLVVTYSEEIQKFTVTWKNWDGSTLETDASVPYGTTPEYNGETPTREETASHSYTFTGWDQEISPVTGDVTYTAVFDSEIKASYDFTIEDGIITSYTGNDTYVVLPSTYSLSEPTAVYDCALGYSVLMNIMSGMGNYFEMLNYSPFGFYLIEDQDKILFTNINEFIQYLTITSITSLNLPFQIELIYEYAVESLDSMTTDTRLLALLDWTDTAGNTFSIETADGKTLSGLTKENYISEINTLYSDPNGIDSAFPAKVSISPYMMQYAVPGDDYEVTSIEAAAFAYSTTLTSITIPESITSIGEMAFLYCTALTEINFNATNMMDLSSNRVEAFYFAGQNSVGITVNIGANVTRIPANLFHASEEPKIISVHFANNSQCTEIGDEVFSGCNSLTNITFGENSQLISIGSYAFESCSNLTNITIPDSVTSIGEDAFYECNSLVYVVNKSSLEFNVGDYGTSGEILEIVSDESDVVFIDIDGNRYKDYNGERYFIKNLDGSSEIEIDSSCTQIYQYAFHDNADITSVIIPDSVTSIGNGTFEDCTSLTSVTIPDSVTSIGSYAFDGCSSLVYVVNKSSLEFNIGDYGTNTYNNPILEIVSNESEMNLIEINGNLYKDYNGERYFIKNLDGSSDIEIDSSCTQIYQYTFYDRDDITSVSIPDSVTSIGSYAFSGCISLTDVYYSGDINDWVSISFGNGSANPLYYGANLYVNGNELVTEANINTATSINAYAFRGCTSITSVTIGNQVTSIGSYAFQDCSSLTSITIGEGVTSIGSYAFQYCSSLTSITIPESVTSIGSYAFYNCSSLTSVTIESNYAYKSATSTSACGYLLQNATEVRVLTICIGDSTNSYLEDTATFTKTTSEDGLYYIYTKI